MTVESLAQVAISGLQAGCIYALMALSYLVILNATGILNFAQGEWMMLAAVLGFVLLAAGMPYPLVILTSVLAATALALLAERLVVRPLTNRHAPHTVLLISLFGVLLVARYGAGSLFDRQEHPLPGPLGSDPLRLAAGLFILPQTLLVYAATAAIFGAVWLFLQRTWLGRSLRVAAIDPLAAEGVGVNLGQVRLVAFGLGGIIAALVGWLYGPLYAAGYLIGIVPGIKGFIALIIGGTVSVGGALVGGLVLGLIEAAAARYLPSVYSEAVAFLALMVVLFARPSGLLGSTWQSD
jgi:branched-chain amino acid transport system permease protein